MAKTYFTTLSLYGVLMLAALPLAMRWVPPNRWYGFRFPGAQFAPDLWYRLNAVGGQLFIGGLVVCAAINAAALWLSPQSFRPYLPWLTGGLIAINFWLVTTELVSRLPY